MITNVFVYFGNCNTPAHSFTSLESAIEGMRTLNNRTPVAVMSIRFEPLKTVQYRKLVKDENGIEHVVPCDEQVRHISIEVIEKRWVGERTGITPGCQYFSIGYFRTNSNGFGGYRNIEFYFARGNQLHRTEFMQTFTSHVSPSTDVVEKYNGFNTIAPTLENLRREGCLHSHHLGKRFSDELVPSVDDE